MLLIQTPCGLRWHHGHQDVETQRRAKRHVGPIAHIDVAGLGGIMLFFLMLFMIPAVIRVDSSLRWSVDLPLAAHSKSQPGALKEDAIDVAVSRNGMAFICGERVSYGQIPDQIRDRMQRGSEHKVYLRADSRAKYVDVAAVAQQIRRAGIDKIVIMVESPLPKQPT